MKCKRFQFIIVVLAMVFLFSCANKNIELAETTQSSEIKLDESSEEIKLDEESENNQKEKKKSIFDYVAHDKTEPIIEGDVCYITDYYGGPLEFERFGKYKKISFAKNVKVKIEKTDFMFAKTDAEWADSFESGIDEIFTSFTNLESVDLTGLDLSETKSMMAMFTGCVNLKEIKFGTEKISNVENMYMMFTRCAALEKIDLSMFETSKVKNMYKMFSECGKLKEIKIDRFDTSSVETMRGMFYKAESLSHVPVENFNTKSVIDMSYMFYKCLAAQSINVSSFDTSKVQNMNYMFGNCQNLSSIDITNFNVGELLQSAYMFYNCFNIENIDLSNFIPGKLNSTVSMFAKCKKLQSIKMKLPITNEIVEYWNNPAYQRDRKYIDYTRMFEFCSSLKNVELDFEFIDESKEQSFYMENMFRYCEDLEKVALNGFDWNLVRYERRDSIYKNDVIYYVHSRFTNMFDGANKILEYNIGINGESKEPYEFIREQLELNKDLVKLADKKKTLFNKQELFIKNEGWKKLLSNDFFVDYEWKYQEFYEYYETNRYNSFPNFVTADSLLHTYHIFYDNMLKKVEKDHLLWTLESLCKNMANEANSQVVKFKGTEWEQAAKINLAFFTIAAKLVDDRFSLDNDGIVDDIVNTELERINASSESKTFSSLLNYHIKNDPKYYEDYTQYKPRGHYDGDEALEKYFRVSMWLGRMNFPSSDLELTKAAMLMCRALKDSNSVESFEEAKNVTEFFVGKNDDQDFDTYNDLIYEIYGKKDVTNALKGSNEKLVQFIGKILELDKSTINSEPGKLSIVEKEVNFRFLGQKKSYDAEIFDLLTYDNVKENASGEKRFLPDFLDVPAAFGSGVAYDILKNMGETGYEKYDENLNKLRQEMISKMDSDDSEVFAIKWLKALKALIYEKTDNYPVFMKNNEWEKKNLETFAGSYAELKHDTILYSKQHYAAEMGEGGLDEFYDHEDYVYDTRGYVEPQVILYKYFNRLIKLTNKKLTEYNYLSEDDGKILLRFEELSNKLMIISIKELNGEKLTKEEYEFIEYYGGDLEHILDGSGHDTHTDNEDSEAIIADIATGNENALEIATGNPVKIYVLVEVDGVKKIASGAAYSFYQFSVPASERMTDKEWRVEMKFDFGYEEDENWAFDMRTDYEEKKAKFHFQDWTDSYKYSTSGDYGYNFTGGNVVGYDAYSVW